MHQTPRRPAARTKRMKRAIRQLLLAPLTPEGARIIDIVILPVGAVVAFFVCIPIWILTVLAAAGVGSALVALGAPESVRDIVAVVGIGGGLVLSFVALLRIYRRVPAGIRSWVTPDDEQPEPRASATGTEKTPDHPGDLDADAPRLEERLAAADAALAPGANHLER